MITSRVNVGATHGGAISPFLFGGLTEHFGHGIYGGLWDTERGAPRGDVLAAIRALGTTMLRYPGGCFSDWYHWRDGVGPPAQRPVYESTFWTDFVFGESVTPQMAREFGPRETNAFGTDEFLKYCLDVDAEPMLVVNFGTGSPEEAADWVAYCNRDGHAPRPVRWWGVGNESYGEWELGACTGKEYATRFVAYAEAMRAVDPSIRLIAVGCLDDEAQHPGWNSDVLRTAGPHIDALSLHWYFPGPWLGRPLRDDISDSKQVASGADELGSALDRTIAQLAEHDPAGRITLSLDEWNLFVNWSDLIHTNHRLIDALFIAGCFNRMLERSDRLEIALVSHLVNCMAPIQTEGERSFVTASYLVQQLYRRATRSTSLPVEVTCDSYDVPPFADAAPMTLELTQAAGVNARRAAVLDAAATGDSECVAVFLANRLLDEPHHVVVSGVPALSVGRFRWVHAEGPYLCNSADSPATVGYREYSVRADSNGVAELTIPPHSAGVLELAPIPELP